MSPRARAALRLGAYQLLFMRVPPHAAVGGDGRPGRRRASEASSTRSCGARRRLHRRRPAVDRRRRSSVRTGMRRGRCASSGVLVGDDEAEPAAAALGERGRLTLRTNTCATSVDALDEGCARERVTTRTRRGSHPDSLLLDGGDPAGCRGFDAGVVRGPGPGVGLRRRRARPAAGRPGARCVRGPGRQGDAPRLPGRGDGGRVVAGDVRAGRGGLDREHAPSGSACASGSWSRTPPRPAFGAAFDRVLVDAPVLGDRVGSPAPRAPVAPARDDLCAPRAAPGGDRRRSRGPAAARRAARLLGVHVPARGDRRGRATRSSAIVPSSSPLAIDGPDGPRPRVRLWPHRHGCDGMFVAAFTQTAA